MRNHIWAIYSGTSTCNDEEISSYHDTKADAIANARDLYNRECRAAGAQSAAHWVEVRKILAKDCDVDDDGQTAWDICWAYDVAAHYGAPLEK